MQLDTQQPFHGTEQPEPLDAALEALTGPNTKIPHVFTKHDNNTYELTAAAPIGLAHIHLTTDQPIQRGIGDLTDRTITVNAAHLTPWHQITGLHVDTLTATHADGRHDLVEWRITYRVNTPAGPVPIPAGPAGEQLATTIREHLT